MRKVGHVCLSLNEDIDGDPQGVNPQAKPERHFGPDQTLSAMGAAARETHRGKFTTISSLLNSPYMA